MTDKEYKARFIKFLLSIGEKLNEPVTPQYIKSVFGTQGFWVADEYRVYYSDSDGFYAQPRLFSNEA